MMSKYRLLALISGIALLTGCLGTEPPKPDPKKKKAEGGAPKPAVNEAGDSASEQKVAWAQEVVEPFFTACKNGDNSQAATLISSEMKAALGDDYQNTLSNRVGVWQLTSWELKSNSIAPNGKEVRFLYRLHSERRGATDLTLHVSESAEGTWRVSFLSDAPWQEQPAEDGK